jgi:hypothetical protein
MPENYLLGIFEVNFASGYQFSKNTNPRGGHNYFVRQLRERPEENRSAGVF